MKKREKKRGNIRKDNIQERKRRKRNTLRFQSLLILFRRLDSIGSGLDQLYKNGLDLLLEHTHTHTHTYTQKEENKNRIMRQRRRRRRRKGREEEKEEERISASNSNYNNQGRRRRRRRRRSVDNVIDSNSHNY